MFLYLLISVLYRDRISIFKERPNFFNWNVFSFLSFFSKFALSLLIVICYGPYSSNSSQSIRWKCIWITRWIYEMVDVDCIPNQHDKNTLISTFRFIKRLICCASWFYQTGIFHPTYTSYHSQTLRVTSLLNYVFLPSLVQLLNMYIRCTFDGKCILFLFQF